jgi:hypothetical protein
MRVSLRDLLLCLGLQADTGAAQHSRENHVHWLVTTASAATYMTVMCEAERGSMH